MSKDAEPGLKFVIPSIIMIEILSIYDPTENSPQDQDVELIGANVLP